MSEAEEIEEKRASMTAMDQKDLWERVSVTPFKLILKPWYKRLAAVPKAFVKHYSITRKHMPRLVSLKWAFIWTWLLLFPKSFMRFMPGDEK